VSLNTLLYSVRGSVVELVTTGTPLFMSSWNSGTNWFELNGLAITPSGFSRSADWKLDDAWFVSIAVLV
jgi:hypothetical protein